MDYMIPNNARMFDELLEILSKYHDEAGVADACENLRAAKINYVQRSIDHMLNCLVLAVHDLSMHPPSSDLQRELKSVIDRFVAGIFEAGSKLNDLAHQYEAAGGKLLSRTEILAEVDDRRGTSR